MPEVLRLLQQDSLVTVLNLAEMRPVDPLVALTQGYVYGDEAVVELLLTGEMILLREWTVPLMPDAIKERLAAFSAPAEAAF